VKYANERVQFNTPIEFGAIRSKLAEMAMNMQMKVLLTELQKILKITAREAEGCTHQKLN
jgi:alkylation response protein AidB-like acyl-CoA dehydrogenase